MTDVRHKEEKAERIYHAVRLTYDVVKGVLIAVTCVIVLGLLNNLTTQAQRIEEISKGNREIQIRLQDCTTPGGKCFKEGQARTGNAVVQISEISKIAAVCADKPGTITAEEMDNCIQSTLKARSNQ